MIKKVKDADAYYQTVSRWLKIKYKDITKRHSLYEYTKDSEGYLVYFTFQKKDYALGQFIRFDFSGGSIITLEDGTRLIAYDATENYSPLLLEVDNYGEKVRLWKWHSNET